jgi:DNA-directed RNA polymerase subunit RPC12/RpoP
VDEIMNKWETNKSKFIKAFGGKLIYEVPYSVKFSLDNKEKQKKIDELVTLIAENFNNVELAKFIEDNSETFYENKVSKGKEKIIPTGAKLVKSFKHFETDKNLLNCFQSKASQIIQEDMIEGTLCFSVHPLDFLSSSENTYNWRSCHSLDGEYKAGNISYMCDSSTVICYLKSKDNVKIPNFPEDVLWNSKKWRVLLFLSYKEKMLLAGRQYPFSSSSALNYVKNCFIPIVIKDDPYGYSDWCSPTIDSIECGDNDITLNEPYIAIRGHLYPLKKIIVDCEDALHFNDLLYSSSYVPLVSIKDNVNWMPELLDFCAIGHGFKCLHCGKEEVTHSCFMVCDKCAEEFGLIDNDDDEYIYCDYCGRRVHINDSIYVESCGE